MLFAFPKNYIRVFSRDNLKRIISILIPILIMALLTIPNLENREMWFDEAHNVMIGKNVLEYGYPRIWDGVNYATLSNGDDSFIFFLEMYLNWFPYYIAALDTGNEIAVGSFNYHHSHFAQAYNIRLPNGLPAHSCCIAFGLERLAYVVISQIGLEKAQIILKNYLQEHGYA